MTRAPRFDLGQHLQATGAANPDRVSRQPRATRCPSCAADVLAGLDADRCGFPARLDPYLLDAAAELAALLTDRGTWRLHTIHDWDIQARDQFTIPAEIPGRLDSHGRIVHVLAGHRCGALLSATPIPSPATVETIDFMKEPTW